MSRGLGKTQRACLLALESNPDAEMNSVAITAAIVGRSTVTPAEHSSVRRALRKLADAGLAIDMGRGYRSGRRHWALPEVARREYRRLADAGWRDGIPERNRYLLNREAPT